MKKMRICLDIDGVIANFSSPEVSYSEVTPLSGAVESLLEMKSDGHYIILCTARHMRTTNGNVGLVVAKQGLTLLNWLDKHGIVYDELFFGKPWADLYIDDNALRFDSWDKIPDQIKALKE
jgi:capsule biosynthesis phosphatase